jgi:nicotinamidase/pyrazinamidase
MGAVFFDIDTQIDFMVPAGALYVPGAERLIPAIAELNRYAARKGIPVVSSMDAHGEDDPEFRTWPAHCVAGTVGQLKAPETMLESPVVVPDAPARVPVGAPQILLEKTKLDLFTNPNIGALLEALGGEEYVVYGVVTEYCVRCAAMGLLGSGKPVTLVADAIQTLKAADSDATIGEFTARGGRLATVSQIVSGR